MKGRRAGLFGLVLLLIIGLLSDVMLLPLVAMLGIMALLAVELWEWRMFKHVDYQRELGHTHLFPDNRTTLSITLRNRKFLPLPFVNLHDLVPVGITLEQIETQPAASPNYRVLARAFGISSYQQVTRQFTILCPQRGLHRFGPANLSASDPLGLSISRATINEIDRLIVYPRLLTEPELGLPLRELLGTIRASQRLLTDPVVPIGIRDYTQSDPLKSIHWTATARRGQLQTRIYEPVTALTVMCILDIETIVPSYLGVNKFQGERLISMAATVCSALHKAGHAVGLWSNAALVEGNTAIQLPPNRSPKQASAILEVLAQMSLYSRLEIAKFIGREQSRLPLGATVLLISAVDTPAHRSALTRLREYGYAPVWLYLGQHAPKVGGVKLIHSHQREP